MDVTVVGLGKIGLPLAVQIAGRGHRVRHPRGRLGTGEVMHPILLLASVLPTTATLSPQCCT